MFLISQYIVLKIKEYAAKSAVQTILIPSILTTEDSFSKRKALYEAPPSSSGRKGQTDAKFLA
jgi:hypothetical protein